MRKTCRRRAADPRHHPVRLAMLAGKPTNGAWLLGLRIAEREAVAALVEGSACHENARTIRAMVQTAGRLARAGIGPELLHLVERAEALALRIERGAYRLADPDDAADLLALVDLADDQRALTDRATFERLRWVG